MKFSTSARLGVAALSLLTLTSCAATSQLTTSWADPGAPNAALKSRYTKTIVFETYSPEEIADIAEVTAQGKNQILSPEAKATVVENVSNMVGQTDPGTDRPLIDTAGNGRFARTIVETATAHKNNRFAQLQDLSKLSEEDLQTLTDEDVRLAIKEIVDGIL